MALGSSSRLQPIDAARAAAAILAHITADSAMLDMIMAEADADGRAFEMGVCGEAFAPMHEFGPDCWEYTSTPEWLQGQVSRFRLAHERGGWRYLDL